MAFSAPSHAQPKGATGVLVLADGTVVWGKGFGATGNAVGEVCFNTAMTGYEEVMTDPSYAAQIVTFTFPHIGNVGTNLEDIETITPFARGVVMRGEITEPANWRAAKPLDELRADRVHARLRPDLRQRRRVRHRSMQHDHAPLLAGCNRRLLQQHAVQLRAVRVG